MKLSFIFVLLSENGYSFVIFPSESKGEKESEQAKERESERTL